MENRQGKASRMALSFKKNSKYDLLREVIYVDKNCSHWKGCCKGKLDLFCIDPDVHNWHIQNSNSLFHVSKGKDIVSNQSV